MKNKTTYFFSGNKIISYNRYGDTYDMVTYQVRAYEKYKTEIMSYLQFIK